MFQLRGVLRLTSSICADTTTNATEVVEGGGDTDATLISDRGSPLVQVVSSWLFSRLWASSLRLALSGTGTVVTNIAVSGMFIRHTYLGSVTGVYARSTSQNLPECEGRYA